MAPVIQLDNVRKGFQEPSGRLEILSAVTFSVQPGEVVLLQGPSGSGKTTLLQIAGCLLRADEGRVIIAGQDLNQSSDEERTAARQNHIGFAFQHFHLFDALTVYENVALGLYFRRRPIEAKRITDVIELLGISSKTNKKPKNLSGGEKQRVALARALVSTPALLLADEPTSQLDAHAAENVSALVRTAAREYRCAALIATHDVRLHAIADRICNLQKGKIDE